MAGQLVVDIDLKARLRNLFGLAGEIRIRGLLLRSRDGCSAVTSGVVPSTALGRPRLRVRSSRLSPLTIVT